MGLTFARRTAVVWLGPEWLSARGTSRTVCRSLLLRGWRVVAPATARIPKCSARRKGEHFEALQRHSA